MSSGVPRGVSAEVLVLGPDTLVRFRNGRMLVHTTGSELRAFETEHPALLGWLSQFAKPVALEVAMSSVPAADQPAAIRIVDYLKRSGVLVRAESAPPPLSDEQTVERTREHLRLLARRLYDLAADLHGLGPRADRALAAASGIGTERRLLALVAAVDGLRQELLALRAPHIAEQLARLGVARDARELKLHIGCGPGHLEGWVNIDVYPAPLAMNVLWGLPFAPGSARFIFVSHMLEHLYFPAEVKPFLAELRRVLAPGGTVRIVVPDIEQCIAAYTSNDRSFFASRRETWSWWPENATRLEDFLAYAGAGPEPAWLFEAHKYGYDFETLERVLGNAGFSAVVRSDYMQSAYEELRVDHSSSVARARYGERYYSLFVEASAPLVS
jgi:predicted SAM-dependent methyltransferase